MSEHIEWVDHGGKRQVADKWDGTYRCQFCGESSEESKWKRNLDADGNEKCPKCGRAYDAEAAMLAQEQDD